MENDVTIKQMLLRDLSQLPLLVAFVCVCEFGRQGLAPPLPALVVAIPAILLARQIRRAWM